MSSNVPSQFTTGNPISLSDIGNMTHQMFKERSAARAVKLTEKLEKLKKYTTPGWQWFKRMIIFLLLIGSFAIGYYVLIRDNPDEWSASKDADGNPILNPLYTSTIVTSTIGYGDYYPLTQRGIAFVVFHTLITWMVFSLLLG